MRVVRACGLVVHDFAFVARAPLERKRGVGTDQVVEMPETVGIHPAAVAVAVVRGHAGVAQLVVAFGNASPGSHGVRL